VLARVHDTLMALASEPDVRACYAPAAAGAEQVSLRLVSPLAEGSDRLAAESALALGYRLETPLPFPQPEYERDFPASIDAFRTLLSRAVTGDGAPAVLALDGGRGPDNDASYRAVGHHVVRNCDLLIAVWNGAPPKAPGGTGDIVRFATRNGVPVWWIHATEPTAQPRLIRNPLHLRQPDRAARGDAAEQDLERLLRHTMLPPATVAPHRPGVLGQAVHHGCRLFRQQPAPLKDYLHEPPPASRGIWRAYAWFLDQAAPRPTGPDLHLLPPEDPVETWWERYYRPADGLSLAYGDRYRSSYVMIFALAALALICASLALVAPLVLAVPVIALELVALLGISALVLGNHLFRWHDRWIIYRLLAELCRKQHVLAPLGWSLPVWEVERMAAEETDHTHGPLPPRDAWVAWYFTAVLRAAPLPHGALSDATLARARALGASLMDGQAEYHRVRYLRSRDAGRRLGLLGEAFFLIMIVVVAAKLWLLLATDAYGVAAWLGLAGALLPAPSAAFVGIRAYAEFELLMHQSARMQRAMAAVRAELDFIDLSRPLASQELGAMLNGVAISMMQDVQGWVQLFRVKALEAG
ncbi:MAG: hypothetical protein ACHQIO_07820, partial [Nevskiales bacterium]